MTSFKLIIFFVSLLAVQACSLTHDKKQPETAAEQSADIKAIGKDMLDMAAIPDSANQTSKASENSTNQPITANNETTRYQAFLAQQALTKTSLAAKTLSQYQSAIAEMKQKNWQAAITSFNEINKQQPSFLAPYLNKALAFYQLKKFDLAINALNSAEKITADNPYLYNLLGIMAREQGRFVDAEKHYQQALTIWPNYGEAHLNTAVLYELYRGDFAKAKTHYQAYLALTPNDQQTKNWLAGLEIKLATQKMN